MRYDRERHAVQDVDFEEVRGGAVRVSEQEQLKPEGKCQEPEIACTAERSDDPVLTAGGLTLHTMHHECESNAGKEEKNRWRNSTNELRNDVRSTFAQLRARKGMKYVTLKHDRGRHASSPVEERQSRGRFLLLRRRRFHGSEYASLLRKFPLNAFRQI